MTCSGIKGPLRPDPMLGVGRPIDCKRVTEMKAGFEKLQSIFKLEFFHLGTCFLLEVSES